MNAQQAKLNNAKYAEAEAKRLALEAIAEEQEKAKIGLQAIKDAKHILSSIEEAIENNSSVGLTKYIYHLSRHDEKYAFAYLRPLGNYLVEHLENNGFGCKLQVKRSYIGSYEQGTERYYQDTLSLEVNW
jgi:transposase